MARILIRPDDLARLARRFDAVADELARAGRRLARTRAEVRFNPADEAFPSARVAERAALVEAALRRLAAEFVVDAGLMARTVDDAEVNDDRPWAAGLSPGVGLGVGVRAPALGSVEAVVSGLLSLGARSSPADDVGSFGVGPVGAGGLFAVASGGGDRQDLLVRLTERLEASVAPDATAAGSSGETTAGVVWSRIVGELFDADDGP